MGASGFSQMTCLSAFNAAMAKGGMMGVGGGDVDDVDVGVVEEVRRVGRELRDFVLLAPAFEDGFVNVAPGDQFGMFRGIPAGNVAPGNAAYADDADFQSACHGISSLRLFY